MALYVQQSVGLGTVPNDDTGDDLRAGGDKINDNNDEVFGATDYDAGGAKVWVNEPGGIAQSQQGVKFGGPAAANLLDDYEEGTFTPTVIGVTTTGVGTYSEQSGRFTKIGDMVHFQIGLVWSAHTGTGNMRISGLPFTSASSATGRAALSIRTSDLVFGAGKQLLTDVAANTTLALLFAADPAGGASVEFSIDTAATIYLTGSYQT